MVSQARMASSFLVTNIVSEERHPRIAKSSKGKTPTASVKHKKCFEKVPGGWKPLQVQYQEEDDEPKPPWTWQQPDTRVILCGGKSKIDTGSLHRDQSHEYLTKVGPGKRRHGRGYQLHCMLAAREAQLSMLSENVEKPLQVTLDNTLKNAPTHDQVESDPRKLQQGSKGAMGTERNQTLHRQKSDKAFKSESSEPMSPTWEPASPPSARLRPMSPTSPRPNSKDKRSNRRASMMGGLPPSRSGTSSKSKDKLGCPQPLSPTIRRPSKLPLTEGDEDLQWLLEPLPQISETKAKTSEPEVKKKAHRDPTKPTTGEHVFQKLMREISPKEAKSLGFDRSDVEELVRQFQVFDRDASGNINVNELRSILRYLGHAADPKIIYNLCQQYDSDGSGEIDVKEFLRLMSHFLERERERMQGVFEKHDEDGSGEISSAELGQVLRYIGYQPTADMVKQMLCIYDADSSGSIGFAEFFELTKAYRQLEKARIQEKAGFPEAEVDRFQGSFNLYDRDKSGELSFPELLNLLRDMDLFPKNKEQQAKLNAMMQDADKDESGQLTFAEMLHLMRRFHDEVESEQYSLERKAQERAGFSDKEVAEFWEVFDRLRSDDHEGDCEEFTIFALRTLLRSLGVTLNSHQLLELRSIFRKFAKPSSISDETTQLRVHLPFPDFLMMMSHLIENDFAEVGTASMRTAQNVAEERAKIESLMKRVQDHKDEIESRRMTQRMTWKSLPSKEMIPFLIETPVTTTDDEQFRLWYQDQKVRLEKRRAQVTEYREIQERIKRVFGKRMSGLPGDASPENALSPKSPRRKDPWGHASAENASGAASASGEELPSGRGSGKEIKEPRSPKSTNVRGSLLSPAARISGALAKANPKKARQRASIEAFKDLMAEVSGDK